LALRSETLGDPEIAIAAGTGIAIGGIGLVGDGSAQPGTIDINVPGAVQQVLLYWTGHMTTNASDNSVLLNGSVAITGTLIGGPTLFFHPAYSSTQRADITSYNLISSGDNSLTVEGLEFDTMCPDECQNLGAGLLVIYDDGGPLAELDLRDGNDNAFFNFDPPLDTTVPQIYNFAAASEDRYAQLHMFAGSVAQFPDGGRPNTVEVIIDGTPLRYPDPFQGRAGDDFDAVSINVFIPAGATSMSVQALSERDAFSFFPEDALPASFNWLVSAAVFEPVVELPLACRVTGGEVDESANCTACPEGADENNRFTCGGQAGASTALSNPLPSGEWTHSQKNGFFGRFTFHAGTASAPEGTMVDWIECMDPGWCVQARPAPAKQIDFGGIGTFKNLGQNVPSVISDYVTEKVSLHRFEVNIDDGGEPGKAGKIDPPGDVCPVDGYGLHGSIENSTCECPDFYRIRIYRGTDESSGIMYEVEGYLGGGNFQIHPPTGLDRKGSTRDGGISN